MPYQKMQLLRLLGQFHPQLKRFDHLKDFAGGLARSLDGARGQLEHNSLEGIMQCKEHERLKSVIYGKKINNSIEIFSRRNFLIV